MADSQRRDRIAGALLGVHAGDALGATVEFSPWEDIRSRYPDGLREIVGGGPFDWPPGHATDDTDLTRAVLLAYLTPTDDVVRAAADHMLAWYDGDWPGRRPGSRPRDIGRATAAGLRRYRHTGDPRTSGAGPGQAGNGSLMRCIPTALAVSDRDRRISESLQISAITHDDPRCTTACAAYNEIVAALLAGATPDDAVAAGLRTAHDIGSTPATTTPPNNTAPTTTPASSAGADSAAASNTAGDTASNTAGDTARDAPAGNAVGNAEAGNAAGDTASDTAGDTAGDAPAGDTVGDARAGKAVGEAIAAGRQLKPAELAATGPASLADAGAGYVLDSLTLAVAAVLDPRPLPEVLADIVRVGNDTDTNAAIAGGLLGARDGAIAIPARWLSLLQFADEFIAGAAQLSSRHDAG